MKILSQFAAPATARSHLIRVGRHCADPPGSQELTEVATSSQFAAPSDGEVLFDLNRPSLRWTSQQLTNVATFSQLAARSDDEAPADPNKTSLRRTSQEPMKT